MVISASVVIVLSTQVNEPTCLPTSLGAVKPYFPVKEPRYLPEGYRLQVIDPDSYSLPPGSGNAILLNYAKHPMCTATGMEPKGDVIVIIVFDTSNDPISDPLAYYNKVVESYNSVIPNAAELIDKPESSIAVVKVIKVNDYIGVAREPNKGYSVYIFRNEDGSIKDKVVEELDDVNAGFVNFYHEKDKVAYNIVAKLPVEEMIKMAESIP